MQGGVNMNEVCLKARAKINLSLDVLAKRPDGYHEVKMIMQTVNLYDLIYIKKIRVPKIIIQTNLFWLPTDERNLAYRAAKLFLEKTNIESGIFIELDKKIPVAAGLAGGSSDAAAVLVGLNKLFKTHFSKTALMEMGKELGADVPYCIFRQTALAEGIGEKLTELPSLPSFYVLIAKPPISVSTAEVYQSLNLNQVAERPNTEKLIDFIERKDIEGVAKGMVNVLEEVTIKKYPVIDQLKKFIIQQGALGAMMSGSGPTVFGIFKDKKMAQKAYYKTKVSGLAKEVFLVTTFTKGGEYER